MKTTWSWGGRVLSLIIIFAAVAYAGEVKTGEVTEVQKGFIIVEDFDTGKPVKIQMDHKTQIKGTLQKGALIQWEDKRGHAVSINVVVDNEETEEELPQKEPDTEQNE